MAKEEPFTKEKLKAEIASGKRKKATGKEDVEWEEDEKDVEWEDDEKQPSRGRKFAGKAKNVAKGAAGKTGKWLTGKGEPSDKNWLKIILPWVIAFGAGGILYAFGFSTIALIVVIGFLVVMLFIWLFKKYPRIAKIIIIPTVAVLLFAGYFWISGTGLFYNVQAELPGASDADIEGGLFAGADEWIQCNVVAPGTCIEEAKLSEDSGIELKNLATALETYRDGDEIEISGEIEGTTWTADWGSEGPDLDALEVTVDVIWEDKEHLRAPWECQQPEGANSDFTCWYEGTIDSQTGLPVGLVKNPRADMCGVNFPRLKLDAAGSMNCKADVSINYEFSSTAFRILKVSSNPDGIDWGPYSKDDVMFSTGGPVGFTIGSNREWNEPITPSSHRKSVPIKIYSEGGLTSNEAIKPVNVTLELILKPGITLSYDTEEFTATTNPVTNAHVLTKTEFDPEIIDSESGPIEFKINLAFSDAFLASSETQNVHILGKVEYEVTETKSMTVAVKYDMSEEDMLALSKPLTIYEHYRGLCVGSAKTCGNTRDIEKIFNEYGAETEYCQEADCWMVDPPLRDKRVLCTCDISGSSAQDVYCCNSWKCEQALQGTTSLTEIDAACDTFNIVE